MRSKEELKRIFIKEASEILDKHFNEITYATNKLLNNETGEDEYRHILSITDRLRKEDKITEEELQVMKENMVDWQVDLLPLIINKFNPPSIN